MRQAAKTLNKDEKDLISDALEDQGYETRDCPDHMMWYFLAFLEVSRARLTGPGGPLALQWQDLESWRRLMGLCLTPYEVSVLTALDDVWMRTFYGNRG